jgi:hypothetical protein
MCAIHVVTRGQRAVLDRHGLVAGNLHVHWGDGVGVWEPSVSARRWSRRAVIERAIGILGHSEVVWPDALDRSAFESLLIALRRRRPGLAAAAAARLCGRGPGLTPAGDDLLAGTLATLAVIARSVGLIRSDHRRLIDTITAPASRQGTTDLSATLLRLSATGRTLEPIVSILDLGDPVTWRVALRRLLGVGHSTGRTYAFAIGTTAWSLAS